MLVRSIQVIKLKKNLLHQLSLNFTEDIVILDIFLNDNIRIQKSFQNTLEGNYDLLKTRNKLDSEGKIKQYLNIKE